MSEARFIEPMPCLAVKKLPEGEGWQYELKLDGYRALVVRHERRRVLATWFVLLLVVMPPLVTTSITRLRLKLPGFWLGGNSRKLCSHCPMYVAAGAKMKARQRSTENHLLPNIGGRVSQFKIQKSVRLPFPLSLYRSQ